MIGDNAHFGVDAQDARLLVDILYPPFSDPEQPTVEVELVSVRAACRLAIWFDGKTDEWVVQVPGEWRDDEDKSTPSEPHVAREIRIDAGVGLIEDS